MKRLARTEQTPAYFPVLLQLLTSQFHHGRIMSVQRRVEAIGNSIRSLVQRLSDRGFPFDHPSDVFPGPERDTVAAIVRIERDVGEIPAALKMFWLRVGSVDLCGSHPEWKGCSYPDPLVIYTPSVAIQELDEFLTDKEERLRCNFLYAIPIAPDPYHKANVSGGMWYKVSVPAVAEDPPLNDERHRITFLAYLELALQWAGFLGLERYPGHSWPVTELTAGSLWT